MNNIEEVTKNYKTWYLDLQDKDTFEKRRKEFLNKHIKTGITRVQIEPTQRCNYSCQMCPIDELNPKHVKRDLSLEDFKLIIDNLPNTVTTVCMSGLGEPFLNKEYIKMLQYAKENNLQVEVYNNGSLFNKDSLQYIDFICFSVDALTKQLIEDLRKGVKYDKLFESIRESVKYRDKYNKSLNVVINFTISNMNYKEIPLLFEACNNLNVSSVQIQAMANNYSVTSSMYASFSTTIKENTFKNWEYIINSYKKAHNFNLSIWYPRKLKGFCNWTFSSLYVNKNLDVISCCHRVTKPTVFGSLNKNNIDNILKSKELMTFKKNHVENNFISICENCPF